MLNNILPLEKMQSILDTQKKEYQNAVPFPHAVIDHFFDEAILDAVLAEFPSPEAPLWKRFNRDEEIKLASQQEHGLGIYTRWLIYNLNSSLFLNFLSELSGIQHLISDPYLEGGGLHQIKPGGKLGIHADFNKHKKYQLDRRLNVLIYLNKNWGESDGGHLELWDRHMTSCQKKILPLFNRIVVFSTTDFTYHGHPDPLTCPADQSRKSIALYYYTNGRPQDEIGEKHNTLFKERPNEKFKNRKKSIWEKLTSFSP